MFHIDCRNRYESDMGLFKGAIPLNTDIFSETWEALDRVLEDAPPNQRVLTYCTGGIRCVKVNAYLKQKLGFHNVGRLEKGIIAYEKWVDGVAGVEEASEGRAAAGHTVNKIRFGKEVEVEEDEEVSVELLDSALPSKTEQEHQKKERRTSAGSSLFEGKNFLFDRRRLVSQQNPTHTQ
mmetsp:Transcript_10518/g.17149  ORF Transcript_10518/g.17149 Transcript_10518/m.17149 type:complete len:179 (+) Transcript_10518:750-1286(+)